VHPAGASGRAKRAAFPAARLLALPAARLGALLAAGLLVVSLLAGALRILPLLLAPGVPLRLAPVLARGLLGVSLETALFVAPPLAWALSAARLVDRGEARALFAVGVRPRALLLGAWPALVAVALCSGLAAAAWGREAAAPGKLLQDLIIEAREACEAAPRPAAVPVPLTGISWVCLPGEPARAVGEAPFGELSLTAASDGHAPRSPAFAARTLTLAGDLRSFEAGELLLLVPGDEAHGALRVTVGNAVIQGIPPLGRASNLRPAARALLIAGSTTGLAILAAALVLLRGVRGRVLALAIGLAGPAGALMAFSSLERGAIGGAIYGLVPAAGVLAIGALALGMRLRERMER
jgi:hypothetical protein